MKRQQPLFLWKSLCIPSTVNRGNRRLTEPEESSLRSCRQVFKVAVVCLVWRMRFALLSCMAKSTFMRNPLKWQLPWTQLINRRLKLSPCSIGIDIHCIFVLTNLMSAVWCFSLFNPISYGLSKHFHVYVLQRLEFDAITAHTRFADFFPVRNG